MRQQSNNTIYIIAVIQKKKNVFRDSFTGFLHEQSKFYIYLK